MNNNIVVLPVRGGTYKPSPTHEFANVTVDGVANVKIILEKATSKAGLSG